MKLSCTQENLNKGLDIVERSISRNVTLPILNNILLETSQGRLKLSATDLEIGINCLIGGKIEQEGKITVSAHLLANFISSLPNKKINLQTKKSFLNIQCENFKANIKTLDPKDFPIIPKIEASPQVRIKIRNFQKALSQVIVASATTETRPEIAGVFINFDQNEIKVVATDSYRLAEKTIRPIVPNKEPFSIILPSRAAYELIRVLSDQDGEIKITPAENQILFYFNNVDFVSRLIEGQYPDYTQIIPSDFQTRAVIDTKEFIKIIKIASLFASKINDVRLKFRAKQARIEVQTESVDVGDNFSQIPAKIEGKDQEIAFNFHYLLDGLNNIETSELFFEISNQSTPGVLKPIRGKNYLYLIMPIKA